MAVFYINNCTYANCDKTFENLSSLIYHVEEAHIDFDPAVVEQKERQKPQCVALSYVLRFSQTHRESLPTAKENSVNTRKSSSNKCKRKDTVKANRTSLLADDHSWNNGSNSENLTRYIKASSDSALCKKTVPIKSKQFTCPIPGCNKRYKNINGIKYHTRKGHTIGVKKSAFKGKKFYTCPCGKVYKTIHGMKAHCVMHKDLYINVNGGHSPMLSAPRAYMINHLEQVTDCTDAINTVKSENDDDILNYSFPHQIPKLSDTVDENSNVINNLLTSPNSLHNHILSDSFVDNLSFEEMNNSHYSFSYSC